MSVNVTPSTVSLGFALENIAPPNPVAAFDTNSEFLISKEVQLSLNNAPPFKAAFLVKLDLITVPEPYILYIAPPSYLARLFAKLE